MREKSWGGGLFYLEVVRGFLSSDEFIYVGI